MTECTPADPSKSGWHWLKYSGKTIAAWYAAGEFSQQPFWSIHGQIMAPVTAYRLGYRYHSPRPTPEQWKERTRVLAESEAENTRLRAALAQSELPCVYCSLPKADWAKCAHGFPGCDRADDAMGCPELGARLELEQMEALLRALVQFFAMCGDGLAFPFKAAIECGLMFPGAYGDHRPLTSLGALALKIAAGDGK